jgi:hypothetical protein
VQRVHVVDEQEDDAATDSVPGERDTCSVTPSRITPM